MELQYKNKISPEDYLYLRKTVGWPPLSKRMAKAAVENSFYLIAAYEKDVPVAMARVISDGGYLALMYDIIVTPACQGKGAGRYMIEQIKKALVKDLEPEEEIMLHVMSAKGKEEFYEKLGFERRPNEELGAGMTEWICELQ